MLIVFAALIFMSTMMKKELGGSRDADVTQKLSKLGSLIDKVFKFISPDCDIPSMNQQPCKINQYLSLCAHWTPQRGKYFLNVGSDNKIIYICYGISGDKMGKQVVDPDLRKSPELND